MRRLSAAIAVVLLFGARVTADGEPVTSIKDIGGLFSFRLPAEWGVTPEQVVRSDGTTTIHLSPDTVLVCLSAPTRDTELGAATDRLVAAEKRQEIYRALIDRREVTVAGRPAVRLKHLYDVNGQSVLGDGLSMLAGGHLVYFAIQRPAGAGSHVAEERFDRILGTLEILAPEPPTETGVGEYRHPTGVLAFKVPAAWELAREEIVAEGDATTLAIRPDTKLVVEVREKDAPDAGTIADAALARQRRAEGFKALLDRSPAKAAGIPAVRLRVLRAGEGGDIYSDQVYLTSDAHEIVLRFERVLSAETRPLAGTFEEVLASLRIPADAPAPANPLTRPPEPGPAPEPEPEPEPEPAPEPEIELVKHVDPIGAFEILLPRGWNRQNVANSIMVNPDVGTDSVGILIRRDGRTPYIDFATWKKSTLSLHKKTVMSWVEKEAGTRRVGRYTASTLRVVATTPTGPMIIEYDFVETPNYYLMLQCMVGANLEGKYGAMLKQVRESLRVNE